MNLMLLKFIFFVILKVVFLKDLHVIKSKYWILDIFYVNIQKVKFLKYLFVLYFFFFNLISIQLRFLFGFNLFS